MSNLNIADFQYSNEIYELEFKRILTGITACYQIMLNDNVTMPNDENKIRDTLRKKYLNNRRIRDQIGFTGRYVVEREVPEDNDTGRVDIKIITQNTLVEPEAYYIIECKRLDNKNLTGISGLNAAYINDGIMRFIKEKYSAYYGINGMLGFVVKRMSIVKNVKNINKLLRQKFKCAKTQKKLTAVNFIKKFKHSYYSIHKVSRVGKIKLYHLMFDFSKNIEN